MLPSHARFAPPSRLRLPRRTARLRLTALYGALFLVSGAALLASTYVLFERATQFRTPQLPKVPRAPTVHPLQKTTSFPQALYAGGAQPFKALPAALSMLTAAQQQLAQDQHRLIKSVAGPGQGQSWPTLPLRQLTRNERQLTQDEQQLTQDQHRLAQAVRQLTRAEHKVTQTGSAEAAQRATDSHQLLVDSGIALAVVGVLAVLAGWLVAGRMLRPIRTITRTARRISSTSLHERLALDGPEDELKELGDTLDDLFARLDAAFEAQRRFVANASHELRTPLTRERALVQVALGDPSTPDVWRSTGRELLASNREQERLIEALLTLASSESGLDRHEQADLADICRTVLPGAAGERAGVQVEAALDPAPLEGDPRLIERLVANLVDNAIAHNVPGGRVRISTAAVGDEAVLSVTNSGPVIPAGEIDRLFQAFQRLDPGRTRHRNGHGLGLSIVRAIATAHHATVTARPLPEGGLSVTVAFPRPVGQDPGQASRSRRFRGTAAEPSRPQPPRGRSGSARIAEPARARRRSGQR
jgi:signal transduction histidine kinase